MESTPLVGMAELSQNPAAPLLGRLSDHYGRKPVLLICLFGSAIGYVLFGLGSFLFVVASLMLLKLKPYGANHV